MRANDLTHAVVPPARPKIPTRGLRPFVLLAVSLAIALPCRALQVSPTYQTFEAKSGQTLNGSMTLTNNEGIEVTITPSVKEWFRLTSNDEFTVDKWLKLNDTAKFTLKPGDSKVIDYRLTAPKKAKGELIGAVTFTNKPDANMLTLELSVVQYLAIKGTEKVELTVANVGVSISTETKIGVLVRNDGNVHIRPRGHIYINDLKGKRVTNVDIAAGQPVFPGDGRVYSGTVRNYRLPAGKYEASVELFDVDRPIKYPVSRKKFNVLDDGKIELP